MAALIENGEINQIIVVTDGRFNSGISSIEAAKEAYDAGVIVSTICITDQSSRSDERSIKGAEGIAEAGGGLCGYCHIEDLENKVKDLAHKTARKIIEHIVNRQLKAVIGEEIQYLEPEYRLKIADFIEKYEDNINQKCVIVLDTGGSMEDKLTALKKSVAELLKSLKKRKGDSCIAVIAYAGEDTGICSVICGFTSEISILEQKLELITSEGRMPIGTAILKAYELAYRYYEACRLGVPGEYETLQL